MRQGVKRNVEVVAQWNRGPRGDIIVMALVMLEEAFIISKALRGWLWDPIRWPECDCLSGWHSLTLLSC